MTKPAPCRALALAAGLCLAAVSANASCTLPGNTSALEAELPGQLNAERSARGLPALRLNSALDPDSQLHWGINMGKTK